jgi:hypothetical protein
MKPMVVNLSPMLSIGQAFHSGERVCILVWMYPEGNHR